MSTAPAFLAGLGVAALAAAAGFWFLVRPALHDAEERAVVAERAALRAKRDANEAQQWADSERRRKQEIEDELTALKRPLAATPSATPAKEPLPGTKPTDLDMPEAWDWTKQSQEIQLLTKDPRHVVRNPAYPLVLRAIRAHADQSLDRLGKVMKSDLDAATKSVCATLLGAMEDQRAVAPLSAAFKTAKEPELRHDILRALANLPGDEQTPVLLAVWKDPAADMFAQRVAIHGLARRRHPDAISLAEGSVPGAKPPLRIQAIQTLYSTSVEGDFKETALVPVFGRALRTADGDPQRKIALSALEGFWSKDAIADLRGFAQTAGATELSARARSDAADIEAGKPRPEGAGRPQKAPQGSDVLDQVPEGTKDEVPDAKKAPDGTK